MNDTDKLQEQEIKDRWNYATAGPWKWVDNGMCLFPQNGADYGDYIVFIQKSGFGNPHDAEAIVNAPTDVSWLISQLKQAQEEIQRLKDGAAISDEYACFAENMKNAELTTQLEQAQGEIKRLKQGNSLLNAAHAENYELAVHRKVVIDRLHAENKQLEKEIERDKEIINDQEIYICKLGCEIGDLKTENEQLKADKQKYERELEWYAACEHYEANVTNQWGPEIVILDDGGQRAYDIMKEVKGNG